MTAIPELFGTCSIEGREFPEWMVTDFRSEACVLSGRILCAETGKEWDWKGLTIDDFDRVDYRTIFKAIKWLERYGELCIQSNVSFVAGKMGITTSRVRFLHRISYEMDKNWSLLTHKRFDHITKLKRLTHRRKVLEYTNEAVEKVLNNRDESYALNELGQLVSVKFRKSRRVTK
jgi:hypothetical protein